MKLDEVIKLLKSLENPINKAGMARYGINTKYAFGISVSKLREIAKPLEKNHELALKLWETQHHEARILATIIDEPSLVTEIQMEEWVEDFNSWDLCDQCIMNLFGFNVLAYDKAVEWADRDEEFVKRAGFVMMAKIAVSDKKAPNDAFIEFLDLIIKHATDERDMVKKAVNWALRQIGKRNLVLCDRVISVCKEIQKNDNATAKWIASDALKELVDKKKNNKIKN